MSLLEAANIKKTYTTRFGGNKVEALRNVSFAVEKGEYVAVMGESGSGIAVGTNGEIMNNLDTIGLKGLILALGGVSGSVILAWVVYCFL